MSSPELQTFGARFVFSSHSIQRIPICHRDQVITLDSVFGLTTLLGQTDEPSVQSILKDTAFDPPWVRICTALTLCPTVSLGQGLHGHTWERKLHGIEKNYVQKKKCKEEKGRELPF